MWPATEFVEKHAKLAVELGRAAIAHTAPIWPSRPGLYLSLPRTRDFGSLLGVRSMLVSVSD